MIIVSMKVYSNGRTLAPNAFRTPISRVLSVTETIIIFIKAIDEPSTVMIPISQEANQDIA
jgi:hypothetical protein